MIDRDFSRYFQLKLHSNANAAAYQPLWLQSATIDAVLFVPVGERSIVLAGTPDDYQIECLGHTSSDTSDRFSIRCDLSPAVTLLELSHWLFQRSSRLNSPLSCAQLRIDERFNTEELAANLHTIYFNHLRQPDAAFELRCRATTRDAVLDDIVDLAHYCHVLYKCTTDLGVLGGNKGQAVDIIIPTFGKPEFTLRCIASVLKDLVINREHIRSHFNVKLIVVDDAHPQQDGYLVLKQLADLGCLEFQVNTTNLGFLESCNQAVSKSRENSHIVLLNNDIEVLPGWLLGLLETFEQELDVGLVGSKLIYPDGRLQEAGGIVWQDASAWNLGRLKRPDHPDFNYARSADYISGASIMLRRSTWDMVGGFDRRFRPAYYEDTDLALTIRAQGLKVIYQPCSQAIHHEGISCGTDLAEGVKAYQVANQLKFLEKWREQISTYQANGEAISQAKHRGIVGHILVLENLLLDPEGDAGSLFMMNYCLALQELGYAITYVPMDNLCRLEDKALLMGSRGIRVLAHPQIESIEDIFTKEEIDYSLILMARPGNYRHLDTIRRLAPKTPVSYFTHDLHFLRTERTADNLEDPFERKKITRKSANLKQLEHNIFKDVDLVLHISEQEEQIAQELHPHRSVVLPPVVSAAKQINLNRSSDPPFKVLFVGNFAHAPNITAAHWLVDTIWPIVHHQRPDIQLLIAGKNPPETLQTNHNVQILGYVEDLSTLLNNVQIAIAPLLEGAGVKGKVLSALAHGLPMVTTSIGAEGIINAERQCDAIRVADSAEQIATEIFKLCDLSAAEHQHLSQQGYSFIATHFSTASLINSFKRMLDQLSLSYHERTTSFAPYQPRSSDIRFDQNNSFSHWSHPLA